MELTKEETILLKEVKLHRWFKILEKVADDMEVRLWKSLLGVDLTDNKTLEILWQNQIYIRAIQDFLKVN